mmetsp:Transcript_30454/g.76461  ORF Transcript_30454/g.76461 Transcript_30454/m.76461 type:complete len:474 (-) Transcript_30454:43-1464(-)|eukprot:CAMPEP_0177646580 /NCGR_PEP_ID=MMETSP0447-20121125/9846_1 /TAXON_ID=0 /ORGANISM="Stygamoeba regulata, Strain BSH-02190019" /LENGTH=473 /DNA_ID=CAMNT_0019149115 /DNA_START=134 /DNA_END=1555 /DNA_ORIENTATION=-
MIPLLLLLLLANAHPNVSTGLPLPRVHYVTECGCTGLEQEALVLLEALEPLRSIGHGSRWLSINHCRNRCPHTPPAILALQRTTEQVEQGESAELAPPTAPTHLSIWYILLHKLTHTLSGILPARLLDLLARVYDEPARRTDAHTGCETGSSSRLDVLIEHVAFRGVCPARSRDLPAARAHICRSMNECDRLDSRSVVRCNQHCEQVWVPSRFHHESFAASGVDPSLLWILPEAFDQRLLDADSSTCPQMAPDRFVFMSVFKVEPRKNWETLIRGYVEAFADTADRERVQLYLRAQPYMRWGSGSIRRLLQELRSEYVHPLPQVHIQEVALNTDHLASCYRQADAFVLPTHGEGWGRPIMDAMSLARPVLATNWSGVTEFMATHTALPFTAEGLEVDDSGTCKWAYVSVNQVAVRLRQVFEMNPQERERIGASARAHILENFSVDQLRQMTVDRLEMIHNRLISCAKDSHDEL